MFYKGLYRLVNDGTANPMSLNDVFNKYKTELEKDNVYRLYNSVDENVILNVIKNGNGHIYLKRMPSGRYYDDAVIDRLELLLTNTENDVKYK